MTDAIKAKKPGIPVPTERQAVTITVFLTGWGMLIMAVVNPALWDIELFKILIQAVFITGLLNMVLGFHFSANKRDEESAKADQVKAENSGKAFDAIAAVAASTNTDAATAAGQAATKVADAATAQADAIKEGQADADLFTPDDPAKNQGRN